MTRISILLIALFFSYMALAATKAGATTSRTWTSLTGHQIIAEFIAVRGENLILKDEAGEERVIRMPMLTQADQSVAQQLERDRPLDYETSPTSGTLPRFIAGEGKGYHSVYSHKNFTAKVLHNGSINIQCLEDGKAVGESFRFAFSYNYYDKQRSRVVGRRIASYEKTATPTLSPTHLAYEATLVDDVAVGVNYEFIDNTIQIWGWVVDPPQLKEPTIMHYILRFGPSHVFAPEQTVVEQKEILAPYTLDIYQKKGGLARFPYGDKVSLYPRGIQRIAIDGPLFGKRRISLAAQPNRSTGLYVTSYRDFAPYQGYSVGFLKDKIASKFEGERLIITID